MARISSRLSLYLTSTWQAAESCSMASSSMSSATRTLVFSRRSNSPPSSWRDAGAPCSPTGVSCLVYSHEPALPPPLRPRWYSSALAQQRTRRGDGIHVSHPGQRQTGPSGQDVPGRPDGRRDYARSPPVANRRLRRLRDPQVPRLRGYPLSPCPIRLSAPRRSGSWMRRPTCPSPIPRCGPTSTPTSSPR